MMKLGPMAPLNGDVSFTFHMRHCTWKSMTPLELMVPLASLKPMPYGVIDAICTIGNWIANVFNGTIDTIGINEANG